MNYEKLNVDRFAQNLKDGKYAGLTGARRAIGKTDWKKADRERAHEMANKHFAKEGAATKGKAAKPAKRVAAKKAKPAKVAKKAASAAAKPPKAAKSTRKPAAAAAPSASNAHSPVREPVIAGIPSMLRDDPTTVRQHSTSLVIAALSGRTLSPNEQRTYDLAHQSFAKNTMEELGTAAAPAQAPKPPQRTPKPARAPAAPPPAPAAKTEGEVAATPAVVAPPGTAPRIPVASALGAPPVIPPPIQPSNGAGDDDLSDLSPEERAQHERLTRAARATGNPVPGAPVS